MNPEMPVGVADTTAGPADAAVDHALDAVAVGVPVTIVEPLPLPPQRVRNASLRVLAVLASLYALHAASAVVIPLLLGLIISYALSPLVNRLQRVHLPRAIGAGLLLGLMGAGLGWTGYAMSDDAAALVESLPGAAQKVRDSMRNYRGQSESTIDKVQRAASRLEEAAQVGTAAPAAAPRGVTRVAIERGRFDVKDYLLRGTLGLVATAAQAALALLIAYFLMVSGSDFRRKMVRLAGPEFGQKRVTVQVLDEISEQIRRYLLVQLFTSAMVGLATGLAFMALGLERPAVWGVVAFVTNFVPYAGPLVMAVAASLVAFVQFGNVQMALLVPAAAMGVHAVFANMLTPWLTSRTSRLNAVAVVVGMLGFGALWGSWGLLLGVPILAAVKAVCDRVEDFQAIGELLGP